jgi:hypothetical protein
MIAAAIFRIHAEGGGLNEDRLFTLQVMLPEQCGPEGVDCWR